MIRQALRFLALPVALAAVMLLIDPVAALAGFDPISLAVEASIFALLESGIGVTAALALTPYVFYGGLIAGLYGINALLAPGLPGANTGGSLDPGQAKQTFENSEAPELRLVGRGRIGGLKAFGNTNGSNRYRLVLHCKGETDGDEQYFLGGREVTVDPDGSVTSPPWAKIGDSYCYIKTKEGDGTETAWADLIDDFPDLWTSDHRARGISQSLIKFKSPGLSSSKFLALYQSGAPDLEVVKRGEKQVYDPRSDSNAWTENGILNPLHILLTYPEFTLDDIDLDFIGDEADRADALIDTLSGTTARARCWGVWTSEVTRGANMQKVLDSVGAWIVPRAGGEKIGLQLIDDQPAAEVAIALRNIVAIDWRSGPEGVERPNVCRLKYYSPERNYELAEIDLTGIAWARDEAEIAKYGEKILDIELSFCPDASQAQRRARQMFALARADTGVAKTNMDGLSVWGACYVSFEMPDDLGTVLTKIGTPRVLDDQGQVEIPFVVWPTLTEWDPETDEAPAPAAIPDLAFGSPLTVPDAPAAATVVHYQGSQGDATRVFYSKPGDAPSIEATYRTYTGGNPNPWTSMTEVTAASGLTYAYVPSDLSGLTVDFRVRTYDGDETVSIWSDTLQVTPATDNTAPGTPVFSLTMTSLAISVRVPDSHNVAYLALTGSGAPTNQKATPGDAIADAWTASSGTFTAQSKASNGTSGGTATLVVNAADGGDTAKTIIAGTALGGGVARLWWRASANLSTAKITFTGTGVPADITCTANNFGTFDVSGLSPGSYTFTAASLEAGNLPLDVNPASITITVP